MSEFESGKDGRRSPTRSRWFRCCCCCRVWQQRPSSLTRNLTCRTESQPLGPRFASVFGYNRESRGIWCDNGFIFVFSCSPLDASFIFDTSSSVVSDCHAWWTGALSNQKRSSPAANQIPSLQRRASLVILLNNNFLHPPGRLYVQMSMQQDKMCDHLAFIFVKNKLLQTISLLCVNIKLYKQVTIAYRPGLTGDFTVTASNSSKTCFSSV